MTPQEALEILNQATAMVMADRKSHAKIQEALKVIADFIAAKKDPS